MPYLRHTKLDAYSVYTWGRSKWGRRRYTFAVDAKRFREGKKADKDCTLKVSTDLKNHIEIRDKAM